ncbi:hypothetical protein DI09_88p90 [Mitosporidium daphniae]|uniref:RanBD1 domain-containing protein n=1 Tax=Mitosporidium daphniae TaxID=1485682 RepID=A0A098VLZ8_9MICR|nr:uncharacterized protein DI09_88p90 [Mitosporidium daphniae]KGG50127.1 hypothetical protein DI09_88p90 [Mitosporidium daphniae]|eukprot:XP_013236563.1 uncharacterized protein DI09_88p90 [Mitosporidium daphniae]
MSSSAKEDWLAQTPESKHSLAPAPEGNLPENNPSKDANENEDGEVEESIDVHFEPVVKLEIIETKSLEEEETVLYKSRAKLFRYDKPTSQWKERGTGDVKLLQHSSTGKIRVLMRRDQTLKICANHYILPQMKLVPNVGSDRSWVWSTPADVSDGEPNAELLAIRFGTPEIAQTFKIKFEEAQQLNTTTGSLEKIESNNGKDKNPANEKESTSADDAKPKEE